MYNAIKFVAGSIMTCLGLETLNVGLHVCWFVCVSLVLVQLYEYIVLWAESINSLQDQMQHDGV